MTSKTSHTHPSAEQLLPVPQCSMSGHAQFGLSCPRLEGQSNSMSSKETLMTSEKIKTMKFSSDQRGEKRKFQQYSKKSTALPV